MRSLWRELALEWLGGEASEALTVDSSFLFRFAVTAETPSPRVRVTRLDGVSDQAVLRARAIWCRRSPSIDRSLL